MGAVQGWNGKVGPKRFHKFLEGPIWSLKVSGGLRKSHEVSGGLREVSEGLRRS